MTEEDLILLKCAWNEEYEGIGYGEAICSDGQIHKVITRYPEYAYSDHDYDIMNKSDEEKLKENFNKAREIWINETKNRLLSQRDLAK